MKKIFTLLVAAGFTSSLIGQNENVTLQYFDDENMNGAFFSAISSNGRYIVGENPATGRVFYYDRLNKELVQLPELEHPEYPLFASAYDISDNGIIGGTVSDPDMIVEGKPIIREAYFKDGKWHFPEPIAGCAWNPQNFNGAVMAISPDGSIMSGALNALQQFRYEPVVWVDGLLSQRLDMGGSGGSGAICNGMSDDGRVIAGWLGDSYYGPVGIWVDGALTKVGASANVGSVARNGAYVVGNYYDADVEAEYIGGLPYIWSRESSDVELIPVSIGRSGGSACGITNDGSVVIGFETGSFFTERFPFIIVDGEYYNMDDYYESLTGEAPLHPLFTPRRISASGDVICGFSDNGGRLPWIMEFSNYEASVNDIIAGKSQLIYDAANQNLVIPENCTQVAVYNHTGALCKQIQPNGTSVDMGVLASGVYIVKALVDGEALAIKIVR